MNSPVLPADVRFEARDGEMTALVSGLWGGAAEVPAQPEMSGAQWAGVTRVRLDASGVETQGSNNSVLLAWLLRFAQACEAREIEVDAQALPDDLRQLLTLARAVPPQPRREGDGREGREGREGHDGHAHFVANVGEIALRLWSDLPRATNFVGEIALSIGRLFKGRARFRARDLFWLIEACGPRALPIVSLISFLVGTILAYMGAVQLAQFGAQIYIADLVAIGMVREIGALMTGIILAGRTGAAYAAQLGTMQVNEEIDAFRTLGLSPIDYLVLPRLLALVLMVPLLTLYAGIVGILAGMLIAALVFGVGVTEYIHETISALSLTHIAIGVIKGTVYGALVAFSGCLRGIYCGRSAQAVGEATTSAVVTAILLITVFASLLTIMFQRLGV